MGLFNTRTLQTIYNTAQGLTLLPPDRGGPSLLRDWTTYQTLDHLVGPAIEFTRGSTATFVGSNGLIQSSATNAPRFDYDPITLACKGLLIEEARTNLVLQSQSLATGWGTAGSPTRTNNAATAPDGTTTATLFERTTTAASYITQAISKATSAITYTFSTYAKANTGRYFAFQFTCSGGTGGTGQATFDLQNGLSSLVFGNGAGSGTTSATITNAGNGWYRCSVTTTSDNGNAIFYYLSFSSVSNAGVLTVDSSATSSGFIWGAQLEVGAFATSYIPTTTATVTRSADVAQITGSSFTSFYNQSEGAFLWTGDFIGLRSSGGVSYPVIISNAGLTDFLSLRGGTVIGGVDCYGLSGGTSQIDTESASVALNTVRKFAVGYATNNLSFCSGGAVVGTDTVCAFPTSGSFDSLRFHHSSPNVHILSLAYYPSRLTDAQLQALTA